MERITGGQSDVYITAANVAAQAILPAGVLGSLDSWDIDPTFTYEVHNEVGNPRSVRQQTDQTVKVTINGGVADDSAFALAAGQSSGFLNKKGTPKYHIRLVGTGTDGKFDRTVRWCTLADAKISSPAGNKTMTKGLSFDAEELV